MASTKTPRESILEDGVFYVKDPVIGKRVDKIAKKGFPFKMEKGLDFCKLNTLDDKVGKKKISMKAVSNIF